ncbi:protein MCM10 [Aphelenchoides avenae]|nr:protein MCM10 [Aphelenchus avenae]
MGVIVDKSPYNTSANGNSYMIWRISDLINTQQVATKVLLFGDCLKQHWKLQVGMVIAVSHAQFGDSNDNKGVTLKLMKPGQVIEIGFTPDFGICKATKNDGTPCSQFVNLSVADRCVFHLQSEANKFSSRRGALSALSVPQSRAWKVNEPPSRVPAKVPTGVTTVSRPQASRTVIAKPVPLQTKARQHAQMLSDQKSEEKNKLQELIKKKAAFNAGARSLIRVKAAEREKADDPKGSAKAPPAKQQVSMKQFIQQQMPSSRILQTSGQLSDDLIDLSQSPPKKLTIELKASELLARKRAAAVLKRKATDDFASESGPSKRQKGPDRSVIKDESATAKKSQLGGNFTDDQIRSLLEKKSAHESEALQEDTERETRYFHSKEAEEKVESYLTGTMEIKNCKVVSCKKCEYTSTHQSTYCKIQGHAVSRHLADKRFFRCADCHQRTSAFGLLPTKPCECGGKNWERVAMRDERKVQQEKLQVRGEERKFVNA